MTSLECDREISRRTVQTVVNLKSPRIGKKWRHDRSQINGPASWLEKLGLHGCRTATWASIAETCSLQRCAGANKELPSKLCDPKHRSCCFLNLRPLIDCVKCGLLRFLELLSTVLLNNCSACRLIPVHGRARSRRPNLFHFVFPNYFERLTQVYQTCLHRQWHGDILRGRKSSNPPRSQALQPAGSRELTGIWNCSTVCGAALAPLRV